MFFWRRKREILTEEEQAERRNCLQAEADERCRQVNERMDQQIQEMKKAQRDIDDMRNGGWPGPFDDSAGKARIC